MNLTNMMKLSTDKIVRIRYRNKEECKLLLQDIENQTDYKWMSRDLPTKYIPPYECGHITIWGSSNRISCDSLLEEEYEEYDYIFWYKVDTIAAPSKSSLMEFLNGE